MTTSPIHSLRLLLSFCLVSATPVGAIDGLLGYWTFEDGTAADSSGNAHDGEVIEPGNAWVTDPDRGAVYQSGDGSFIELGSFLPVIDVDTDFTWSFWVKPNETDNNNIVFGNRWNEDGSDFSPREFIKFTPRVFEWHFGGGGENVGGDTMFVVDEWAHNLVVKQGEDLTYYRDGEEVGSGSITGAPENPQPLYLGGQNGNEVFSGLFDEVAVFDRALAPDEVEEVYQLGLSLSSLAGTTDDPNLIAPRREVLGRVPASPAQREGSITLQNRGSAETLTISAINVTGPQSEHFQVVAGFPSELPPGASGTVNFIFDSMERTGAFLAHLEIESNDSSDPLITIELSASIINLQGPRAHYRFDEGAGSETARDSSGWDRDGQYQAGAGDFNLGTPGLADGAALSVSDGAQARILGEAFDGALNDFTLSLWFQAAELSADLRTLIGKGGGTPSFAVLVQEGAIIWIEGEDPSPILASSPNAIQAGQAHHLVAVSDQRAGSRRIALYLDGELLAEQADPDRVPDERESLLYIGAFNHALGFEGILDDLQVYDRPLSAEHIVLLHENPGLNIGDLTPPDGDGDGLSDAREAELGTDPLLVDTDGDGLQDGAEVDLHGTDPTLEDTDGDEFNDGFEIRQGTDPLDAQSKPEATSVPGLYAYWRLDEGSGDTLTDASGNGRNGTIINADGVWEEDPVRGTVYHSDSSSYADFGEIIPKMDLNNGFTWSFWAKSEETDNNNIVLGNRWSSDGSDFQPREFIKFTPRVFEWHVDGGGQNVQVDQFEVDVWDHHLVVKDGDTLTYYRNGENIGENTISSAPENIQPFYIGGQNGNEGWSGLIDEVALWDRALSEAEVLEVFQLGEGGRGLDSGRGDPPVTEIGGIGIAPGAEAGSLTLTWPSGTSTTVEHSRDLVSWETIAQDIADGLYTDSDAGRTGGRQGYYRLSQ